MQGTTTPLVGPFRQRFAGIVMGCDRVVRKGTRDECTKDKGNDGPAAGSSHGRCGEHHVLYSSMANIPALRVWCVLGGPTPHSVECPSPVRLERSSVQVQASRHWTRRDRVQCFNECTPFACPRALHSPISMTAPMKGTVQKASRRNGPWVPHSSRA